MKKAYKVTKPCGHRVLVKLVKVEDKSKGGIILASNEKELNRERFAVEEAEIVQLGQSAYKAFDDGEPWCAVGDIVSIRKYSGQDYRYEGDIYRIILDDDVLAVLEPVEDE